VPDSIAIVVNGKRFEGWHSARLTRSMETIAGTFELSVSDRWDASVNPWAIREGDACAIQVNGETLLTGFVDSRKISFSQNAKDIALDGRDRAGDLVDCSAVLHTWEFSDVSPLALATKLCAPFGVAVQLQDGLVESRVTVIKKHSIDPGDTVQGALENLCRVAGLLPVSDGRGGLLLTRSGAGKCVTPLEQGKNVKSASATYDVSGRFGEYLVLGSHKGRDDNYGATAAGVRGSARDAAVRASRIHVVRPEGNVTQATAKTRALWEAAVRAARSETVTVRVQGWTQADGSLWPLNHVARVKLPALGADGDMLISALTFTLDADGTQTDMTLKGPQAFTPDPTLGQNGGNGYWKEIARGV